TAAWVRARQRRLAREAAERRAHDASVPARTGSEAIEAVACSCSPPQNAPADPAEPPARIGLPCDLRGADARASLEEGLLMAGTGSCCAAGRAGMEGDSADERAGTHRDVAADPLLRAVAAPTEEV